MNYNSVNFNWNILSISFQIISFYLDNPVVAGYYNIYIYKNVHFKKIGTCELLYYE